MARVYSTYPIDGLPELKQKLVAWAASFPICAVLDNCNYNLPHHRYELIAGIGANTCVSGGDKSPDLTFCFDAEHNDWMFGHVGFEALHSSEKAKGGSSFPEYFFFIPEIVVEIRDNTFSIGVIDADADLILKRILDTKIPIRQNYKAAFNAAINRNEFITAIAALKQHISRGDCYEINFCQEFFAEVAGLDPTDLFNQLIEFSPNPFAAFYKHHNQYALCASPERYVQKTGDKLISQPIKGTAARSPLDESKDAANRRRLADSEKDKRENVIVVDLVRNDMSRVCEAGTVAVEELFGVYDFPSVFQMMSTVTGKLSADKDLASVLQASFPMGSMTGAPKKKVLELINRYELVKRGIYSGTIGYISPKKDFDFNVVIRTLLYNSDTGYLGYFAGAGITDLSDAEEEYAECLLKAAVLQQLFNKSL